MAIPQNSGAQPRARETSKDGITFDTILALAHDYDWTGLKLHPFGMEGQAELTKLHVQLLDHSQWSAVAERGCNGVVSVFAAVDLDAPTKEGDLVIAADAQRKVRFLKQGAAELTDPVTAETMGPSAVRVLGRTDRIISYYR